MKDDTFATTSDQLHAPPPPPYDAKAIARELYESHLHALAKKHVSFEKMFSSTSLPVDKLHGHLTEDEYRRLLRGAFARANGLALFAEASLENAKGEAITSGLYAEIAERFGLGSLQSVQTEKTPVVCTKTGAVYVPRPREVKQSSESLS